MGNKAGFNRDDKTDKNKYEIYKGREVRVYSNNHDTLGVLYEIKDEYLLLRPAITHENLLDREGRNIPYAKLEEKIPTIVNFSFISKIEPLRPGFMKELIKSINDSNYGSISL
ncbi:MAG: hypothetical protein QF567_01575 [Candidatus Pacearchaeota archaeon]|jgi:hypothetical protein|nr:hypothetical protein [Candidatus Pacearchaeota archaeon]|tara:strand:- start:3560 stop:3898 length:339 start_codon:yes stop_codon:yes gene_type:complete